MRIEQVMPCWLREYVAVAVVLLLGALLTPAIRAQDYSQQIGRPTFSSVEPVELGFVDAAKGTVHLEIPIGSFPQRGNKTLAYKLIYDSRLWNITSNTWTLNSWATSMGGWRFVSSVDSGTVGYSSWSAPCPGSNNEQGYNNFYWTAPDGTKRYFNTIKTMFLNGCGQIISANGSATDASGYLMKVTNYNQVQSVTAPDGTQVYPSYKDTNGNFYSKDASGNIIDTLGRTPVTVTTNCGGISTHICYSVLNSQGSSRSTVTVTTASIPVHTNFAKTGITEYAGNITVLQSIALPDGTSYQFTYDQGSTSGHYGEVTGITLPTSGTVSYSYVVNSDALGNKNRWVSQRSSGGGTWSYALVNVNTSAKTQGMTVTQPSGDSKTYSFSLNNGAWRNSVSYSSGMTVSEVWDTSGTCQSPCVWPIYIRKQTETVSLPVSNGTLTKKRFFGYNASYRLQAVKEWDYSGSTNPTRITNITYLSDTNGAYSTANILNLPVKITVTDGTGATQFKETDYAYDGTTLTSKLNIAQHDDTNFGTGNTVRGNLTSMSQWTGASSPSITTSTMYYDTTGQMVQSVDAAGNTTTFDYTDCFLTGNPPSSYTPSQATNAYLTTTTLPISGTLKACYYFYSGKVGWAMDQNGATTSHFFINASGNNDPFDREITETFPIGWSLNNYTSSTQSDTYLGIQDLSASTSCSSCRHDQMRLDTLGRMTDRLLVSDPDGQTTVHLDYDSSGRLLDTSHPYRSTSDSTYGLETISYDANNKPIGTTHQDGTVRKVYYGRKVTAVGGLTTQQCPAGTCDRGYPAVSVDEAGKMRQVWTNAFGKVVEVDEPASNASTGGSGNATGTITFSGSEQSYTFNPCQNNIPPAPTYCPQTIYDGGSYQINIGGYTTTAGWGSGTTATSMASALASTLNSDSASPVTASATGSVVTLTSKFNYALSVVLQGWNSQYFSSPSFSATPSGSALSGGAVAQMSSPTVTYYLYDMLGNVTQVTTVGNQQCNRTYTYDTLSRITSATEPEPGNGNGSCPLNATHTTSYYYTQADNVSLCSGAVGKVCRRTDGRGITTTYNYDALNRSKGMTYTDTTPSVTYYYDQTTYNGLTITNGLGRRTGMSDGSGTTAWSYNANGDVVTEKRTIAGVTKTISYVYNGDHSLKQMTYPSGRVVNFTVNNAQRTTSVVDNDGTQYVLRPSSGAMYAPTGALASAVYGKGSVFTGLTESRSYNNRLQPGAITASSSAGTALNLGFTYTTSGHSSNNGEIWTITNGVDSGRTVNNTYDDLGRILTSASQASSGVDCWGQNYTVDAVGNLTNMAVSQCSSGQLNAAVNGYNQFTTGYSYDPAGNMTNDGGTSYTYNAENELVLANSVTYTYDGNRMRVKKSSGTLYWRNLSGTVIAETNLSGTTTNEYILFAGRRAVQRDSSGNNYYYQADQLGSTRSITKVTPSGSASICYDADFTPYGSEMVHTNTCSPAYKFTGYERDAETGLDYAMNRYYNSRVGRFMSSDPLGLGASTFGNPQTFNRYAYGLNNPVSMVDPLGFCDEDYTDGLLNWCGAAGSLGIGGCIGCIDSFGNDYFDALNGAPGTYLTIDMYGNPGFGFSLDLYFATMNFADNLRTNVPVGYSPAAGTFRAYFDARWGTWQGIIPQILAFQERLQQVGYALSTSGPTGDVSVTVTSWSLDGGKLQDVGLGSFDNALQLLDYAWSMGPDLFGPVLEWMVESMPSVAAQAQEMGQLMNTAESITNEIIGSSTKP